MKKAKLAAGAVLSAALAASLGAAAPAFGMQASVAAGTSWKIPSAPMTNAVTIDGKAYKVVTANSGANWIIAGPDYLGISNSNVLDAAGGSGATSLENEVTSTLMGIWGSEANEVPNAYNWNYFYNLYAASVNLDASAYAQFATQSTGDNYDASTGTIASYKYRPEVMWGTAINGQAVEYIRAGKYFTSNDDAAAGVEGDASIYAAPNDADFNPVYVAMSNNGGTNVFGASTFLYQAAEAAQKAITASANYNSNGAYNENNVNWRTVNALPRTTRYESDAAEVKMSAIECATSYERLMKGAAYYTLSKIADGTTTKKKVAFLIGKDGIDLTGNTATVAAFDCIDPFNPNDNAGFAGALPLAVDQLTSSTVVSTTGAGTSMTSGMTWRTYTVTADELATCDYILSTGLGSTNGAGIDAEQLKQWVIDKCTTAAGKTAAAKIQYGTTPPTTVNAHNFTVEKSIFSAFNFDFVYSDLFPNMELETYWYDNIYHIKSAYLKQTMQWALGNVSLPDGVELSDMGSTYSATDCDNKFYLGYNYFAQNKASDPVISAVLSGTGRITGETGLDFSVAAPTSYYTAWANSYSYVKAAQTIKITKNASKTVTVAKKKASVAVTISGAKTALSATLGSAAKKAGLKVTVNSKKKVTVTVPKGTKAGTYKVTVKAKASDEYKASAAKTITIKVK